MIRIIVNGVSFYTTKSRIVSRTVGDNTNLNEALALLFADLHNGIGIATTMHAIEFLCDAQAHVRYSNNGIRKI